MITAVREHRASGPSHVPQAPCVPQYTFVQGPVVVLLSWILQCCVLSTSASATSITLTEGTLEAFSIHVSGPDFSLNGVPDTPDPQRVWFHEPDDSCFFSTCGPGPQDLHFTFPMVINGVLSWQGADYPLVYTGVPNASLPGGQVSGATVTFPSIGGTFLVSVPATLWIFDSVLDLTVSGIGFLTVSYFSETGDRWGATFVSFVVDDTAVPEPGTLLLLGTGAVALSAMTRRRRAREHGGTGARHRK